MNCVRTFHAAGGQQGFTFFEVMISLIIGTVIIGGVMGVLSTSLQYTARWQEKTVVQPVLEAVAQEILANPELAKTGTVVAKGFSEEIPVELIVTEIEGEDVFATPQLKNLRRVQVRYRGEMLEFSVLVPSKLSDLPNL